MIHYRKEKVIDFYDEPEEPIFEDKSWLLSYMDLLTLLISVFILLLTYSTFESKNEGQNSGTSTSSFVPKIEAKKTVQTEEIILNPELNSVINLNWVDGQVNLEIQNNVLFDSADAELKSQGKQILKKLKPILAKHKGDIAIEGHADDRPIYNDLYPSNWELSAARAASVARFLIEDSELDKNIFKIIGYGDTKPVDSDDSVNARQKNRRVIIVLILKNLKREHVEKYH